MTTVNRGRAVLLVFVLCAAVAFGLAWSTFTDARVGQVPIRGDAVHYVEIYRGTDLDEVDARFRFRGFTP